MSIESISPELKNILDVLEGYPEGAKIGTIEAALAKPIPRRTLFRHLATLIDRGMITSSGQKKGTKYSIKNVKGTLPLSSAGKSLKEQVSLPLQERKPVAYNTDFLYSYQPNSTFYLSETTRKHLNEMGQQYKIKLEPGTYINQIYQRMLIDLSWNSSRLEGNTYSLLETERLIEFGMEAEGKNAMEAQMILNHKDAIEFVVKQAKQISFNPYTILNIHAFLSNNLLANPRARGQLRQIPVGISGTVYHPAEIPQVISECFYKILQLADEIKDPFEQAFFAMVHLPYLQPFEDINKRVSRLASNIPFIKNNLSPLSFIDVPKDDYVSGLLAIYELNKVDLMRDVFIWAYERSSQQYKLVQNTLGDPNIIGIKYRQEMFQLINKIVHQNIQREEILKLILECAKQKVKPADQDQFIHIAEREIMSLHEGNIAIYDITPEIFSQWKST